LYNCKAVACIKITW